MKKLILVLVILNLCLVAGCVSKMDNAGNNGGTQNAVDMQPPTVEYPEPKYRLHTREDSVDYRADDDTLLLTGSYQWLELETVNNDQLSPAGQEQARHSCEIFNARMAELRKQALDLNAENAANAEMAFDQGYQGSEFTDETTVSGVFLGEILNVRLDNYSYFGGAHPNRYTVSYTFDLTAGQFIDPIQIADDPDRFHQEAARLLVTKAEEKEEYLPGYWEDYRDIISRWNEGTVLFDAEGMTAFYPPYEIGPYVMGDVELTVSYDEIADMLGPGGLEKLGLSD